jgi:hypothetical protein
VHMGNICQCINLQRPAERKVKQSVTFSVVFARESVE